MNEEFLLTEKATLEYLDFVRDLVPEIQRMYPDLNPKEIPDEEFRVVGNGQLEVFITFKGQRFSYFFEEKEWARA